MSEVTQADRDSIDARLKEWQDNPEIEGIAYILLGKNAQKGVHIVTNFHGTWSVKTMMDGLVNASTDIVDDMVEQARMLEQGDQDNEHEA